MVWWEQKLTNNFLLYGARANFFLISLKSTQTIYFDQHPEKGDYARKLLAILMRVHQIQFELTGPMKSLDLFFWLQYLQNNDLFPHVYPLTDSVWETKVKANLIEMVNKIFPICVTSHIFTFLLSDFLPTPGNGRLRMKTVW